MEDIFRIIIFVLCFLVSYATLMKSRLDELFKQGAILHIRIMHIILSIILGYLLSLALTSLIIK